MRKKYFFCFLVGIALIAGLVHSKPSHAYTVLQKTVFAEHVGYDKKYFILQNATYVMAAIVLTDISEPEAKIATVSWSPAPPDPDQLRILGYKPLINTVAAYGEFLGYVPPTSFADWENITYHFSFDGNDEGSITTDHELKSLPLPVATYDSETKTVTWLEVADAGMYKVRIIDDTLGYLDIDRLVFDSGGLLGTSYEFPSSTHGLLEEGAIINVEAWEIMTDPEFRIFNSSVYVTIAQPSGRCEGDFDGDVDGSDLAIFAADFGRTDCLE